jgi:hypothetical protein
MRMAKFQIPVRIVFGIDVVVEAATATEAIQRAVYLVNDATPETITALGTVDCFSAQSNDAERLSDDARLLTYTCEWCHRTSFKRDFGAGGQTCPRCKRPPVSAQEFHELHAQQIGDAT